MDGKGFPGQIQPIIATGRMRGAKALKKKKSVSQIAIPILIVQVTNHLFYYCICMPSIEEVLLFFLNSLASICPNLKEKFSLIICGLVNL